jgi:hypothetical protein
MPSNALIWWQTHAQRTLDDIAAAHAAVGGQGPGRRYATQQINNAYAVLLSAQFQKFCRELHSQAASHIADQIPPAIYDIVVTRFTEGRKLDTGNPNPGNLGSDFNRLGFDFWAALSSPRNLRRRNNLDQLNLWRNAISHHDFSKPQFKGRTSVLLNQVQLWRRECNGLAHEFDRVVCLHLIRITSVNPW